MTNARRNRTADLLAHRLDRAARILPTIRDHLDEQRAHVLPLPARGEGGRQGGTHSDPTAGRVAQLDGITRRWDDITDALASINVGINLLEQACAAALGTRGQRAAEAEPVCSGGDPSTWGAAECTQLANYRIVGDHVSYSDLCAVHEAARTMWEAEQAREAQRADESNARRLRRHAAVKH